MKPDMILYVSLAIFSSFLRFYNSIISSYRFISSSSYRFLTSYAALYFLTKISSHFSSFSERINSFSIDNC